MSLTAFRDAAEDFVRTALLGALAPAGSRLLSSSYDAEVAQLRAGELAFALRVWQSSVDAEEDSNALHPVASVEIDVVRKFLLPEDEDFYTQGSMLLDQAALQVKADWRALSGANSLIEPPTVGSPPERVENVITYTVELQMRLNPE